MLLRENANHAAEVVRIASDLLLRYGPTAPRVAQEWAEIKGQQGAPETAAMWQHVAALVVRSAEA